MILSGFVTNTETMKDVSLHTVDYKQEHQYDGRNKATSDQEMRAMRMPLVPIKLTTTTSVVEISINKITVPYNSGTAGQTGGSSTRNDRNERLPSATVAHNLSPI